MTKELSDRMDNIQDEMHKEIESVYDLNPNTKASYQDLTIVFLIKKIAELELKIESK